MTMTMMRRTKTKTTRKTVVDSARMALSLVAWDAPGLPGKKKATAAGAIAMEE
jgi:hypothetical protein